MAVEVSGGIAEKGVELLFIVSDTGIGMTDAEIEKLFQPFVQFDNFSTRKYLGTGLGLAISKRLVKLMGGMLSATSKKRNRDCF